MRTFRSPDKLINSTRWRRVAESRRSADGYCCVRCGKPVAKLDVDHILPRELFPALTWLVDNLQSLCTKCHGKKKGEEIQLKKRLDMLLPHEQLQAVKRFLRGQEGKQQYKVLFFREVVQEQFKRLLEAYKRI